MSNEVTSRLSFMRLLEKETLLPTRDALSLWSSSGEKAKHRSVWLNCLARGLLLSVFGREEDASDVLHDDMLGCLTLPSPWYRKEAAKLAGIRPVAFSGGGEAGACKDALQALCSSCCGILGLNPGAGDSSSWYRSSGKVKVDSHPAGPEKS